MNNKPIAWKVIETDDDGSFTTFTEVEPVWADNAIPLYTQPTKTITDEKITEIYKKVYEEGHENQVIALARAILKKAQK